MSLGTVLWRRWSSRSRKGEPAPPTCTLYCTALYCTVLDTRRRWAEFLDTVRAEHNKHWVEPGPGSVVLPQIFFLLLDIFCE